jgi:hypothetical protein
MAENRGFRGLARLLLMGRDRDFCPGGTIMRKFEIYLGVAFWVAVATLMPMAALEPVAAEAPVLAATACADGCDTAAL